MNNYTLNLLLVSDWAKRNDIRLKSEIKRLNIGVSDELYSSVKSKVVEKALSLIEYNLSFNEYGRFRDMGAGRKKIESQQGNGDLIQKKYFYGNKKQELRKPKKWYSKTFYGRLYALQGVLGASISEQAISAVLDPLKSINQ